MAVRTWIKLDHDWRDDPKVMAYERLHGKAALVDVIQAFCLMGEFYGRADLNDVACLAKAERVMGRRGKRLDALLDGMAEAGVIDREPWEALHVVTSERALKDGASRRKRKEKADAAAEAAARRHAEDAEARAAAAEAGGGKGRGGDGA